jgi:hypothetical protein
MVLRMNKRTIQRIEEVRETIFNARAIAAVAAAAATSDLPANGHHTQVALMYVAELLEKVADELDLMCLLRK